MSRDGSAGGSLRPRMNFPENTMITQYMFPSRTLQSGEGRKRMEFVVIFFFL
jgi:hypothetical protein